MHQRVAILVLLALVSSRCLADNENGNDPIGDTLEKATATYFETIEKAKIDLQSAFNTQLQEVAKTGNLQHVKNLQGEMKALDADGKLPTSLPLKNAAAEYQATVDNARKALVSSYETAVSDYTKKRQIDKAISVNKEFDAFKKGPTAKPLSQANKTADENPRTGKMNEVPIKIPADAVAYKGHHYKYVDDKSTWYIARAKCEKMGGHLICIGDADEDFFTVSLIKQAQGITAWIGASDEEEAGVWRWVNGEPFSYSRWGPGQPDNTNGVETCVEITGFWKDSPWNDGVEGCRFPFVCEWDQ